MIWIRVEESLPEEGTRVLTLDLNSPIHPEYRIDYLILVSKNSEFPEGYLWACRLADDYAKVTHWMPLPKPPE